MAKQPVESIESNLATSSLTLEQIATLEKLDAQGDPILSVYLDIAPERPLQDGLRTAFENLVKDLQAQLQAGDDEQMVETALAEVRQLEPLLDEPQGKALVAFSCASRGVWHAQFLPVRVDDHITFERKTDVAPLLAVLDEYQRYAVALVDKTRARLFTVFLGTIEERDEHRVEDPVSRHDQGGWSQSRYQRHHEAQVTSHLKDAVERLERMFRQHPFDRLVLAGPVEAISEMRNLLSHDLAERVIETTPMEADVSEADVIAMTVDIARRAEREGEERLIDQLVEEEGHQRGAQGFAATMRALYLRNVQTLIVADGVQGAGVECTNPACGLLERIPLEACPVCGTKMERTHDVVHRAMARAISQAGSVEVVHDRAADRLKTRDGIGAIFRFPNPVQAGAL